MTLSAALVPGAALAASASISITADNPPPPSVPTGQASTYTINFTCSAVSGSTCGPNPTITIPLDLTSSNPATADMSTWAYGATSPIAGLIGSASVVGGNYVITLNESALHPGDSDTISLSVKPPNNVTPDATTWSLTPSFQTDDIAAVTAPAAALGAATAQAHLSVSKNTNDGGSVYVVGNNVIYNISARCNPGGSTGNLYLTDGSLVDTLPAGLTFVSASPAPTSAPSVGSSGTVTWSYPDAASLPSGCSATGAGTTSYQLIAELDPSTPDNTSLPNGVTFSGTPIGTATPVSTSATKTITAISNPPLSPGAFVGKSAKGPLTIPSFGYDATYAGNWITPINQRPSSNPGAAEGEYTVSISYPASRAFQTDLADPVPCLDTHAGITYSSNTPSGAINGSGSIDNLCQHPAFNPTAVQVSSASLASAITGDGWAPIAVRSDGTTFTLTRNGAAGSSTYFDVPSAEVGNVSALELPRDGNLTDVSMSMNVWGYGDASLAGGDDLHDIATATAYPVGGAGSPATSSHAADLYIEPTEPQLGVYKSFGTRGAAPGGTTALNLQGNVSTPSVLTGNVVLTDLLPYGLSWHNPVSSASFSITKGQGGSASSVTGTVSDIANFNNTGRELIRVSFSASAFVAGFYTITPPANFIELTVPTAATTYNNTDQLFIKGIGTNTSPTCGPGTTSTGATFESSDTLDLDGDGATNEDYCQWQASLTVPPSGGPSFTLVKTVQGDLDSSPKYSPGIGNASASGSGTYTLQWSNTGGKDLTNPVVYDILPYIGDTGVSGGQSGAARGSQFAPTFGGVSGSLPGGVTVAYSTSSNPCRPEVYDNASNPGCTDDWTTTAPIDLTQVKALRFTATGTYTPSQSFTVAFDVNVPAGYVNTVAWNSAASDADYNGSALLPAEPPKVGLTAPAAPVTPTLSTTTSAGDVQPGDGFTDTIVVGNTGGASGTLTWKLLGPVSPAANGTCAGLDWSSAATVDQGTIPVSGNGTYTTTSSAPTGAGCYGYSEELTGGAFGSTATSDPGGAGETVLVHAATLTTTASAIRILPGAHVTDSIRLGGTGTGAGSIDWKLVGPVAPGPDGTCNDVQWTSAATFDSGTFTVSGDGTYTTPASTPTATGCYSYTELLSPTSVGGPATSAAGASGETVLVAQPSLSTTVSSAQLVPGGTISDAIDVRGTANQPGTIAWTLLGPVAPDAAGGCAGVVWSGAPVVGQGTLAVSGDGQYITPPVTLAHAGCYGYADTLAGAAYGGSVSSDAGAAGEVALVTAPKAPQQQPARVSIVKRVNTKTFVLGKRVTYTLAVTNRGPGTATDVTVTDKPNATMRFVSARPTRGHCGRGVPLTCALGTIAAHHRDTITVIAVPLSAGAIVNHAHVVTSQPNSAPASDVFGVARTRAMVPLTLTKAASSPTVRAGRRVHYTIEVSNGTRVTARRVQVCDQLPAGLAFVSASVKTRLRSGRLCWTIARLAPRGHRIVMITARALSGASGRVTNLAVLSGPALVSRRSQAVVTVMPKPTTPTGVTG